MRDPARISMVLAAVERSWRENPDLRLGQLLMNQLRRSGRIETVAEGSALFNLEDGELLRLLGPVTDDEQHYIAQEPGARRDGWAKGLGTDSVDTSEANST